MKSEPSRRTWVMLCVVCAALLALVFSAVVLGAGCARTWRPSTPTATSSPRTPEPATRFVSCMEEPPAFDVVDWPTPDSVGNVLLHVSTVRRVQGAYADLRRYVDEQYLRCLHVAEDRNGDGVTVEREP